MITREQGLEYHAEHPLKLNIEGYVPLKTKQDLSLAYTPGVAHPCMEINRDPSLIYKYTGKSNYAAVVTDGTAVLGLGDIGAGAGMPVMEGKCLLFKRFGGVDAFPICIPSKDVNVIVETVKMIEPVFGGINLEDIAAPRCFEIEERLKAETDIFIFHDDQHGTAVVTLAGLMNALKLAGKKPGDLKVVFSGAGAAGIAVSKLMIKYGVQKEKLMLCDSKGVIYKGRPDVNASKAEFAVDTPARTLADAMKGADLFVGVSKKGLVTKDMVRSMNDNPIIFAMANPDPEILPDEAKSVRNDVIMATGRSDFDNQINNVLGFPGIFRGALDVHATEINDAMKIAAAEGLAACVSDDELRSGRIIPPAFNPNVAPSVAKAVASKAIETGCARKKIDMESYDAVIARFIKNPA